MRQFLCSKRASSCHLSIAGVVLLYAIVNAGETEPLVDPVSPSGLRYYAQGGVVVEGVAYFTSDDGGCVSTARTDAYPSVVAFDVNTGHKLKTYPFSKTYDSSPLVYQDRNGRWLIVAHEHKHQRSVAIERDTGEVAWTGEANQPGNYFFGYSYYVGPDGGKILYGAFRNGLHAIDGATGKDLWWIRRDSTGGVTPCVDQAGGWVFYQRNGEVLKVDAVEGEILQTVAVPKPNVCISWNTVLVDDEHGYFIVTRWYGAPEWDSAVRVYDADLNLAWEKIKQPYGKKTTITYAEGTVVIGTGNGWSSKYEDDSWKYLEGLSVADGKTAWRCDLSQHAFRSIMNVPYFAGRFFAETQSNKDSTCKIFRINAANGQLEATLDLGRPVTSCATCIIAHGKLFSGDLHHDGIVVTRLATDSTADWPGPFGDPQTNQMAAPAEPRARVVAMETVGE